MMQEGKRAIELHRAKPMRSDITIVVLIARGARSAAQN